MFDRNNDNSKISTNIKNGYPDWLVDHLFNNGKLYIYEVLNEKIEYSHFNSWMSWDKYKSQTLTFHGGIQSRVSGFPWQKRE